MFLLLLELGPPQKRPCVDGDCIIHCSDATGELSSLQDPKSWKSLLNAAEIRDYKPVLALKGNDMPQIAYHRKCRSIFTMKKDLERIKQVSSQCNAIASESGRRSCERKPPEKGTTYKHVCIFCDKVTKYLKGGNRVRDNLVQCVDLRADRTIRDSHG